MYLYEIGYKIRNFFYRRKFYKTGDRLQYYYWRFFVGPLAKKEWETWKDYWKRIKLREAIRYVNQHPSYYRR